MTLKDEAAVWYEELYRLMWAMVWDYASDGSWKCLGASNHERSGWLLEPDELFAELSSELVKVVYRYGHSVPRDELKRILVTSLRNRCVDMYVMTHRTHRKAERDMMSLDVDDDEGVEIGHVIAKGVGVTDPPYFDMDGMLQELSGDGRRLALEVVNPSERTLRFLDLFSARKKVAYPKNHWKLEVTPLLMRRAMGWDKERLDNAWEEIRCVLEYI